jgi:SMC interacting uncharacterized protein involved in chromosome segregation
VEDWEPFSYITSSKNIVMEFTMANKTKKQLEDLNKELLVLNETLRKRNISLTDALDARVSLTNNLADYLKLVEDQLLSTCGSIGKVLESHKTLSAPIPIKPTTLFSK